MYNSAGRVERLVTSQVDAAVQGVDVDGHRRRGSLVVINSLVLYTTQHTARQGAPLKRKCGNV